MISERLARLQQTLESDSQIFLPVSQARIIVAELLDTQKIVSRTVDTLEKMTESLRLIVDRLQ